MIYTLLTIWKSQSREHRREKGELYRERPLHLFITFHISPNSVSSNQKIRKMLLYQYYILLSYNLDYTAAITTTEWQHQQLRPLRDLLQVTIIRTLSKYRKKRQKKKNSNSIKDRADLYQSYSILAQFWGPSARLSSVQNEQEF